MLRGENVVVDAAELRSAIATLHFTDPSDLVVELLRMGTPWVSVLQLVLAMRVRPQQRAAHTVNVALAELRRGVPSRWVESAIRRCFAIYCALRQCAFPNARR